LQSLDAYLTSAFIPREISPLVHFNKTIDIHTG
jgi:hypothetical protein